MGNSSRVDLFEGYDLWLTDSAAAACLCFILVGIPANLITILALARCKKVRNATAYFIMNLSTCDLLFCSFNLPLATSTFWERGWIHGQTLCVLFPLFRYGLMAVSIFTVLAITINRYVMISHPNYYPRLYRTRNLGIMIFLIWIGAFGSLVPTLFSQWGKFGLDEEIGSCSIIEDEGGRSPKKVLFLVAFLLPCLAIVICYARIFYIVRKASLNSTRKSEPPAYGLNTDPDPNAGMGRRRSVRPSMSAIHVKGKMSRKDARLLWMILVIFGTFVLCHLPITLLKLLPAQSHAFYIFSYILIYFTTCMNPGIYVVMSSEYRQAYRSLLTCNQENVFSSRSNNSNKN